MDFASLENVVAWPALLGYLNFAEGRPDPRFAKQLNDLYAHFAGQGALRPWEEVRKALILGLRNLHARGSSAFADVSQAEAVIGSVFERVLPAYRRHHQDLLAHLTDAELWQPFFLARAFEAVLAQRGPWDETERIVVAALKQLNDYLGHRPIAIVENRRRGEPYEHERVRPIAVYVKGAGVAWGRYHEMIAKALELLEHTDGAVLHEACFDPTVLEELAIDPRAYDFNHPADKRPNYIFGEWDPHLIDNQGRYRRFVVRHITLEALWVRVESSANLPREELLFEAASVLAGTILMGAGVSGAGPQTHDSSVNLSALVPRIAQYREQFYTELLGKLAGRHGERLREEATLARQAFGAARQELNHVLGQQRALQLQRRRLALFFAELGDPAASRRQLAHLPVASARMLTEIHIHLTTGHILVERGQLAEAAQRLAVVEDLLRRGIACGALADPWNVLGFSGQYPRFHALEDSVRDHRIDDLTHAVEGLLNLYARVLSEGAAQGTFAPGVQLARNLRQLAAWWDRFATTTVSDVHHVQGEEATASAEHVAKVLSRWRERGAATADLGFWREQIEGFRSPKAFALVVEALLGKHDHRAAMSLLMTWLSQVDEVPLEDGDFSFHGLALRWMLSLCPAPEGKAQTPARPDDAAALAVRFFDYLEANAEDYGNVPTLDLLGAGGSGEFAPMPKEADDDDGDSLYSAAYEDMTYKDSTDDDVDAEVLDVMPQKDFDLDHEAERLEKRLRFLATLAKLWNLATRIVRSAPPAQADRARTAASAWLHAARRNFQNLLELLDTIHQHDIPRPTSAVDAMMEYDRRLQTKQRLVTVIILTCLDHALAIGALRGLGEDADAGGKGPPWEPTILALHRALMRQDPDAARTLIPEFREQFRDEPLLYTPLHQGGQPRHILRAHIAQTILRGLAVNLPRQGLLRETYLLLRLARSIEAGQSLPGPRATEFDRLFHLALQAVIDSLVEAAGRKNIDADHVLPGLQVVVEPFLVLWRDHSRDLRVSMLEVAQRDEDFDRLVAFIRRYGHDLFNARFLTPSNLRAVLQRGIGAWLDDLRDDADPLHPVLLAEELGDKISRAEAERCLHLVINTLLENFDHLRDYNQTTTQSDYGENLYQLFEFLRLKAGYERAAWQFRPLLIVHEVLARQHSAAAALWRVMAQQITRPVADKFEHELRELEKKHGMRLVTIAQRFEERFVKPMELDRLVALVAVALEEAPERLDAEEPSELEQAIEPLAQTPSGVGLDVPGWILRLEQELQRVETARSALVALAETLLQVPHVDVPLENLLRQFEDWQSWAQD